MAVSKRTRFEVLRRDNHTCRYCHATDTPLTIDHVTPVALGGTDDPGNLVAACKDCNAGKSSSNPDAATVAQVSDDAVRWAAAIRVAAERAEALRAALHEQLQPFEDTWWSLVPSYKAADPFWDLPPDWRGRVSAFLTSGMPMSMLCDAAEVALTARGVAERFRYFIGVARNMLAKLQQDAKTILAAEEAAQAPRAQCPVCHYPHEDACGFQWGWRVGITDCPVMHTDTTRGESGHPDHYLMMALSRVVDAPAHEWAATWPYPSELYPMYTGRTASGP